MTKPELEFIKPQWPAPSRIKAMATLRNGGVSNSPYDSLNLGTDVGDSSSSVAKNRSILRAHLPNEPIWLQQVHESSVSTPANRLLEADGIVSDRVNEVLAIMSADCLPILFTNTQGTVIGAAHGGWRGLCSGVLENTVNEMTLLGALSGSNEILAWMGPAIGPEAFEVGQDVLDAFIKSETKLPPGAFISIQNKPGKYLANIYLLARSKLTRLGMNKIYGGEYCTVQQPDQFFSYRRDGDTGRFASLIWIADSE
jgi:YfiH family protein